MYYVCTGIRGFPGGASRKKPACQCRRHKRYGFNPWVGKIPWRWECNPLIKDRSRFRNSRWLNIHAVQNLVAQSLQSCLTLCDPMDCSLPGSSSHGILQARILEWVGISFSRGSSWTRDQIWVSSIASRFFTTESPGKPPPTPKSWAKHKSTL